jgi:hypothetical protein
MSHISKNFNQIINTARSNGFAIEITKKGVKIIPPADKDWPIYIAHIGEKGYHPVRRYLKNVCGLEI